MSIEIKFSKMSSLRYKWQSDILFYFILHIQSFSMDGWMDSLDEHRDMKFFLFFTLFIYFLCYRVNHVEVRNCVLCTRLSYIEMTRLASRCNIFVFVSHTHNLALYDWMAQHRVT